MSNAPHTVTLLEVSPRDGLQNEREVVGTDDKVALIRRAIDGGARRIEAVSFVHPKRVPQMADAEAVMAGVPRVPGVSYAGLVLNERGLERAVAAGVDEVNFVVVASETFAQRNQGQTIAESVRLASAIGRGCRDAGLRYTIAIAAAFGCPFEGEVPAARVADIAMEAAGAGANEIGLADTIGVAVPAQVTERVNRVRDAAPGIPLRLHLHDTRHTAVANAYAGWQAGVDVFDASLGGIGGCPFAPRATGNVATEDLAWMFARMGVETGLDIATVTGTVAWLSERLGRALPGAIARVDPFPPQP